MRAPRLPAIVLMGPTASGKTALALALAAHLPVEIVSVDSAQVYRHLDIGTAKPSAEILRAVPHHLVDILDPTERYSAAQFRNDADRMVADIHARGKIPLLVGGTMLYFKALRDGLSALPAADPDVRAWIDSAAAETGWPTLHRELQRVDPATAARLDANDAQRIQRALEVFYVSGTPLSQLIAAGRESRPAYRTITIALEPGERHVLHARIAQRFTAMLEHGLVDEVRALRQRFELSLSLPSMRAVGYRQVWEYLDGQGDLATLRDRGEAATRQLAKRQLTWLRSWAGATRFDCLAGDLTARVETHVARELEAPH